MFMICICMCVCVCVERVFIVKLLNLSIIMKEKQKSIATTISKKQTNRSPNRLLLKKML